MWSTADEAWSRTFATATLAAGLPFLIKPTTLFDVLDDCASLSQSPLLRPDVLFRSGDYCQCFLSFYPFVVLQTFQVEFVVIFITIVS